MAYFVTFVVNNVLSETFGCRAVDEVVVELLVWGALVFVTWRS